MTSPINSASNLNRMASLSAQKMANPQQVNDEMEKVHGHHSHVGDAAEEKTGAAGSRSRSRSWRSNFSHMQQPQVRLNQQNALRESEQAQKSQAEAKTKVEGSSHASQQLGQSPKQNSQVTSTNQANLQDIKVHGGGGAHGKEHDPGKSMTAVERSKTLRSQVAHTKRPQDAINLQRAQRDLALREEALKKELRAKKMAEAALKSQGQLAHDEAKRGITKREERQRDGKEKEDSSDQDSDSDNEKEEERRPDVRV